MNTYIEYDDYMKCLCSDGTEVFFDKEDYGVVSKYNWFRHRDSIEGNLGGKGRRVTFARIVSGLTDGMPVLRIDKTKFDYRKTNLYINNKTVVEDDVVHIYTNKNQEIIIDIDDWTKVKEYRWYLNTQGYAEAKKHNTRILMHRLIVDAPKEFSYEAVVDHINHNITDNRKSNLRIVSQEENTHNSSMRCTNTSGHEHIVKYDSDKYRSSIQISGVKYDLGLFNSIEEANRALEIFRTTGEVSGNGRRERNTSSTGYRYIYKSGNGWVVTINGTYLGYCRSIEDAIQLRNNNLN